MSLMRFDHSYYAHCLRDRLIQFTATKSRTIQVPDHENRTYTEKAAFSNCFNLFASNSCSRRFFVIAMARWISSRASESLPIFISRSPRTLGKRW